jgi:hypothetical protein
MALWEAPDKRDALLVESFMTGEQRVQLVFEMSAFDHEITKQQLRRDHPEWTELQVKHQFFRQAFLPNPVPESLENQMREREEQERASK